MNQIEIKFFLILYILSLHIDKFLIQKNIRFLVMEVKVDPWIRIPVLGPSIILNFKKSKEDRD